MPRYINVHSVYSISSFKSSNLQFIKSTITNSSISLEEYNVIHCLNNGNLDLLNTVLWKKNELEILFCDELEQNSVVVNCSNIQGAQESIVTNNNCTVYWDEGNINESPLFSDNEEFPLMFLEDSPCIDAGTLEMPGGIELPEFDLLGNPRITSNAIDMDAYEYHDSVAVNDIIVPQITETHFSNYPNPLNLSTLISFTAKIEIYNLVT